MRFFNSTIVSLTLILLAGIITGFILEPQLKITFLALLFSAAIFVFAFLRARKLLFHDRFFGISTLILFFVLGIFTTQINLPENRQKHYVNFVFSEENLSERLVLEVRIREVLKPDLFSQKYVAEVEAVSGKESHGKILLLLKKDSLATDLLPGQKLLVNSEIEEIPAPLNPHQFDYRRFMEIRGIYAQVNLQEQQTSPLSGSKNGLLEAASGARKKITSSLYEQGITGEELTIVQALLLGQKNDISPERYDAYAAAGAIHILAVSGLHVGIILLVLNWMFSPLKRFPKGKFIRPLLIIIFLWGFAILAGLSPSVVRAVTMFSFIAIGMEIKRQTSTLNSIFLSLMLLLLIRPQWIFDVGFQLSYSAVLSIVLFQPLLYGLREPENKILKYFWSLLSTTIAAQLGVLPLSLFYFHQFPGLFFLSNLVILPVLGFILTGGIIVMVLALFGVLPGFLAKAYSITIELLNNFVAWVAEQEDFVFEEVSFTIFEVLGWYLFLFSLFLLWKNFSYRKVVFLLISVILLQGIYLNQKFEELPEAVIFHKSQASLIGIPKQDSLLLLNSSEENFQHLNLIRNYMVGEDLEQVKQEKLGNFCFLKDELLMVIDSSGVYPDNVRPDYLLLSGSPRINLDRLIQKIKPEIIISDGSNYRSFLERWRQTSEENGIPFHSTATEGAFLIR